ncbi:transcription factor domain-containing protein [Aspergillus melleus]|uniref:transcription factor domain-containing protein n=1 Tax=Aspergillus melleus TaxID=138277 RepID=UPI001E8CC74C|nr:uncharacterized protein LDX57_010330 [Aspergillus melleus]KAH8432703.1 hypothetical protein LDX57_010330 [Aspergillus melleus]
MQNNTGTAQYGQACLNCARAKSKCVMSGIGSRGCDRCRRLQKDCCPAPRLRKRKAPSKTELLEQKVDDLMALLKPSEPLPQLPQQGSERFPAYPSPLSFTRANEEDLSNASGSAPESPSSSVVPDLTPDEEEEVLRAFRTEKLPWMPIMHISENTRPIDLKTESPFVWLCITAIQNRCTSHTRILCDRAREEAGRRMMLECEKSLDLLQGALIYLAWITFSCPSDKTSLCTYTQMACAMLFNLRLQKPPPLDPNHALPTCNLAGHFTHRSMHVSLVRTMNERRALLGCYLMSSAVSQFVGLTEPMTWTPHMTECLDVLSASTETPNDAVLVQLVSTRRITDKIPMGTWNYSDPNPTMRAPYAWHVKALESQLTDLTSRMPLHLHHNKNVMLFLQHLKVAVYETALLSAPTEPCNDTDINRLDHLYTCLSAIKEFSDIILSFPPTIYPDLSMPVYILMSHCFITLFRLSMFDYPGWDKEAVRRDVDLLDITGQLAERMTQVPALIGIVNDGTHLDTCTRFAEKILRLRAGWEARMAGEPEATEPGTLDPMVAIDSKFDPWSDTSWLSGALMSGAFF